jgi:hypothetical protein
MQATPQTDTVTPVELGQFAQFVGADPSDPLLPGLLIAATDAAIRWINQDLTPRQWVCIVPVPDLRDKQISPQGRISRTVELPYTALIEVESVTAGGVALDWSVQPERMPAKITVPAWDMAEELKITYTAGMTLIPVSIKTAIMMIGGFLFDHRGGCDAMDAISKSGAINLLRSYRVEAAL